jgi:hypothetical protein
MPLAPDSSVDDVFLYSKAVQAIGYQPAGLKKFPWYHATFPSNDSLNILPYALIRLRIGAKGDLRDRNFVSSNFENYGRQVMNASMWGKFLPAKWKGRAISSNGYLLVSFFPTLVYPTSPYPPATVDTLTYHNRLQLRFLTDTAGLIIVPIPREAAPAVYHIPAPSLYKGKTVTVRCSIDSCGISRLTNGKNESEAARKFLNDLASQIRFYPAMDVAGHVHPFEGIARLTIGTEPIVRIEYLWLP